MKIATNAPELTMGNVGTTGQFTIKASMHSFRILSSGLYSNKIKAIIRELSCNAVDSHVAAGNADTPFLVHLPNYLEPYFSVRDYGTGLSAEDVMTVYTRYFESTKQDSNDYIGALGLGSKSPFSYTDNFTVTAILDGVQRIYSAFIDDTGCPSIAEMGCCDTNEPNGVEVKFSVTERNDIYRFTSEANDVFKWFKHKPIVTGNSDYRELSPEIKMENISPGVHLANIRGPVAVQGNIAYPIRLPHSEDYAHLRMLLDCPLIVEFNIGDIEIAASREELSYTVDTIKAIIARYEIINEDVSKYIADQISPIACEWEKAIKLTSLRQENIFHSSVTKLVEDGVSKLLALNHGYSSLMPSQVLAIDVTAYEQKGLNMRIFEVNNWRRCSLSEIKPKALVEKTATGVLATSSSRIYQMQVSKNMVFVTNDNSKKVINRVREHYRLNGKNGCVVMVLSTSKECTDSAALYKEFFDAIYNPPMPVAKASDFEEPVREISAKHDILVVKKRSYSSRGSSPYVMTQLNFVEDPAAEYLYVPLSNFAVLNENGRHDTEFLYGTMQHLVDSKILNGRQVYGVRKGAIEEIKKRKNWKCLHTVVKKHLKKYDASALLIPMYNDIISKDIINKSILTNIEMLDSGSEFKEFCKEVAVVLDFNDSKNKETESYKWLMEHYNIKHAVKVNAEDAQRRYEQLFVSYPMLKFLLRDGYGSHTNKTEQVNRLLEYIKLIDNTRGNTK